MTRMQRGPRVVAVVAIALAVSLVPQSMRAAEAQVITPVQLIPRALPIILPGLSVGGPIGVGVVVIGGLLGYGVWEGGKWAFGELEEWNNKNQCEGAGHTWLESRESGDIDDWIDLGGGGEAKCVSIAPPEFSTYEPRDGTHPYTWSSTTGGGSSGNQDSIPQLVIRQVTVTAPNISWPTDTYHTSLQVQCRFPVGGPGGLFNYNAGGTYTDEAAEETISVDCVDKLNDAGAVVHSIRVFTCGGPPYGGCTGPDGYVVTDKGGFIEGYAQVEADRQIRTVLTCRRGDGSIYSVQEMSVYYAEGDQPPILPAASCLVETDRAVGVKVDELNPEGEKPIMDYELPQSYLDPNYQFHECMTKPCALDLWMRYPDGTFLKCADHGDVCRGWASAPSRDDIYECHWGPYQVDLNQCLGLRWAYETVNPHTTTVPAPEPLMPPIGDPATHPNPNPVETPNPNPQPGPNPDPDAGFWSNLLYQLFVPQNLAQQAATLQVEAMLKPPFSLLDPVSGVVDGLQAGWGDGGCGLMPHFMPIILTEGPATIEDGRIPCEPPPSTAWSALYAFMGVAIVAGTGWRLFGMAGAALGGRSTGDAESDTT